MKVNADNWIESFIEKPKMDLLPDWRSEVPEEYAREGKFYLASMGIYMFRREFLEKLFEEHPEATDFGKEIIPTAIESGYRVASYSYNGYWTDIGTIRSFFDANIAMTDPVPQFNLFDNYRTIFTHPRLLAPSKIFGTFFNQAVLAEGSIIHAKKIERSIIGIRSRIGDGTEIANANVMGADYYESIDTIRRLEADPNNAPIGIGRNCHIEYAIVDKDARIGHNVVIKGSPTLPDSESDTHCVRDGIVVLKKKAYIPDGTRIGA
jgi:glucose-1-phosphate adenylyltransferase